MLWNVQSLFFLSDIGQANPWFTKIFLNVQILQFWAKFETVMLLCSRTWRITNSSVTTCKSELLTSLQLESLQFILSVVTRICDPSKPWAQHHHQSLKVSSATSLFFVIKQCLMCNYWIFLFEKNVLFLRYQDFCVFVKPADFKICHHKYCCIMQVKLMLISFES